MPDLALLGGAPALETPLAHYRSMGPREAEAVRAVVDSDCLSGFYGSWGDCFLGGPRVREFEAAWAARFGSAHCVSVNSATSGLMAALGAVGVGPGDEVIVPPYTMSATATAPLVYGAVPVFADIEDETFCLDIDAVRANITGRTRAVLAVNLFGHPARLRELRALCDERGIALVEDNAQGPLAREDGRFAGTIGHIGVFSLNYHKHLHTGEGGMCVTDDADLARRMQLIRNHAENCVEALGMEDVPNMVGFNLRMTELSAAVGLVQLADAETHVSRRVRWSEALTQATAGLDGLTPPKVRRGCGHVYYVWACRLDEEAAGFSRKAMVKALAAENVPLGAGYVRPLYLLPLFRNRLAFGSQGYPFSLAERTYEKGLCPVCERMHFQELFLFEVCMYDLSDELVERMGEAFRKVWRNRDALAAMEDE